MMPGTHPTHTWKFFRTGGLDQVSLETGADLLCLDQLDQKLWVALSCPVKGLELDEKTLTLIDSDKDGHIRVPELLAAIKWAGAQVKDAGIFLKGVDGLPLDAINEATPEGKALRVSAQQILVSLGKRDAGVITVADAADTAGVFAANPLNGSGVVPPEATDDPEVQALIKDIIATLGGETGRASFTGVTAAKVSTFFSELEAYVNWLTQSSKKDIAILGDATDGALGAIKAVRAKVDDFFARCRLAAYDPRSIASLNRQESEYLDIAAKDLKITAEEVSAFPLAHVTGTGVGTALPLLQAVNPAYASALVALHTLAVTPIFGTDKVSLTEKEWLDLNARFAPYETWLGSKTGSTVEKLGLARAKEILAGKARAVLAGLLARDETLAPQFSAISDVERLTRLHRDLRTLVNNFVNFSDFYASDRRATFQAGVLYLDSRSTEFCVRVESAAAHATLAAMSKAYIAYVDCKRGGETMTIAASFTQGDGDYLFVGRNGVFYDRKGRDWDATIVKIIDNPVSLRQAFWSPYKKFVRMIDEQVAKRAAAADTAATNKLAAAAEQTANADKGLPVAAPAPTPPKKVDVGTVAALGVAVGAIGGAIATVSAKLVELVWWQIPLIFVALILIISIPSVIIAWLKLRQRTVGPILDANGWAINGRVKINIPFGTKLTSRAELPPGSKHVLGDPYAEKSSGKKVVVALIILLVLAAIAIEWDKHNRGYFFWEPGPVVKVVAPPAGAAAKP